MNILSTCVVYYNVEGCVAASSSGFFCCTSVQLGKLYVSPYAARFSYLGNPILSDIQKISDFSLAASDALVCSTTVIDRCPLLASTSNRLNLTTWPNLVKNPFLSVTVLSLVLLSLWAALILNHLFKLSIRFQFNVDTMNVYLRSASQCYYDHKE